MHAPPQRAIVRCSPLNLDHLLSTVHGAEQVVQFLRAMTMCWPASTSGSRAPIVVAVVFTVSCSSQQGASACNDADVVRVVAAPRTVVMFLELLVMVKKKM